MSDEELNLDEQVSNDKNLVWHYTDTAGLLGMVRDHELWAGHLDYMNDTREGSGLREALNADDVDNDIAREIAEGVLTPWSEIDWDPAIRMPSGSNFIVSTSHDSDSLTMWRGYGRSAAAYAIGIDKRFALRVLVSEEETVGELAAIRWSDVEYDTISPREEGGTAIERIRERVRSLIEYLESEGTACLNDDERATAWLQHALALYKNPHFIEERESRLSILNVPANLWNWRSTARGPIPYLKLTGPGSIATHCDNQELPSEFEGLLEVFRRPTAVRCHGAHE